MLEFILFLVFPIIIIFSMLLPLLLKKREMYSYKTRYHTKSNKIYETRPPPGSILEYSDKYQQILMIEPIIQQIFLNLRTNRLCVITNANETYFVEYDSENVEIYSINPGCHPNLQYIGEL